MKCGAELRLQSGTVLREQRQIEYMKLQVI
jgi:hypothetical protein